jgi:hypothetical protein
MDLRKKHGKLPKKDRTKKQNTQAKDADLFGEED